MDQTAKLDRRNVEDITGLSPMQEGMLFHYLSNPSSGQYFEQYSYRLSGRMDLELFNVTWKCVIENNEMLRAVYRWEEVEKPVQIILRQIPFGADYADLSLVPGKAAESALKDMKAREKEIGFDLRSGPLFRVNLCKIKENAYEMTVNNHHILFDGWSYIILLEEFLEAYNSLARGNAPVLRKKLKFKEYLRWLKQQDRKEGELFWRNYLEGYTHKKLLPADRARTGDYLHASIHAAVLAPVLVDRIKEAANQLEVTQGTILTAAWGRLLQLYNNTEDMVFGVTVSGRSSTGIQGIENLVGLMINTLPMRLKSAEDESTANVIKRVAQDERNRQEYEYVPLADIHAAGRPEQRTGLFDNILVIENYPVSELDREDYVLKIDSYSGFGMTNYDFVLVISAYNEIVLNFIYNAEIFDEVTVRLMQERYVSLLETVTGDCDCAMKDFKYITDMEKEMLDYGFIEFDY